MKDVVIIGGGISGLATAYRLREQGLDIALLEKKGRVGGAILTHEIDGFLVDCGPNSTLETSPKIRSFIDQVGLKSQRIYANSEAKKRYILKNGKLQQLPMSPPAFFASGLFSAKAKMRLLAEPFIRAAPEDKEETVAEFVQRRLGREFLDYAINPFVAGVYAGDPTKLSVRSAVEKVYLLEKNYGSLIKGAIKGAKERKRRGDVEKTKAQLFSFKKGMAELPNAFVRGLGDSIRTGCAVQSIEASVTNGGYRVTFGVDGVTQIIDTRTLVMTSPAHVTAKLLSRLNAGLAATLEQIEYPPVVMVFLGFKKAVHCRPLDGFGFLVPQVEGRKILGTIWSSTIFPGRAPINGAALTTFVGGARQPELALLEEGELVETVRSELKQILGLDDTPDVVHVQRWQRAIPQYTLGHVDRINAIKTFETANPGIFVSGNFRKGISVGDCIVNSEEVARRVMSHMRTVYAENVT